MENMFCFQCEQTANGKACEKMGVCGKNPKVAGAQDKLTCEMIRLASAMQKRGKACQGCIDLLVDGLFTSVTNVSFDDNKVEALYKIINEKTEALGEPLTISQNELFSGDANIVSLRSTLLFGLRGMAAYAHHARILGFRDKSVDTWVIKGLAALAQNHSIEEWLSLLMEFGHINLKCMELLEKANTGAYGHPVPVQVPLEIEKGPFIVVTGHDLYDLKMLLEQTQGQGVNIYTHGEMLPAHGYPELKKYAHLKGNFGTAWQNQQKEFDALPAPILFTTNCLMPPKASYADRVFTTSLVAYPQMKHIAADEVGHKNFSEIIAQAKALGGYSENKKMQGINGGSFVTTGFGRETLLANAPAIIDAVNTGAVKHFFLVGGCDGARPGRNYYTNFVKQSPKDSIILTLACGKFRFNDLDLGNIGPFNRILDVGQCNDSYAAIQIAIALAGAFKCGVNELPLTLVLSWYEQKAVCILLTLLALGIKNIYIGPSLPAFFSADVLKVLVDTFNLTPITTPEADLKKILA